MRVLSVAAQQAVYLISSLLKGICVALGCLEVWVSFVGGIFWQAGTG